jgi:hypothetical protein
MVTFYETGQQTSEQVAVYDPASYRTLRTLAAGGPAEETHFLEKVWTADGRQLILSKPISIDILSFNGAIRTIQAHNDDVDTCGNFGILPHLLNDGRIAYLDPRESVLVLSHNDR